MMLAVKTLVPVNGSKKPDSDQILRNVVRLNSIVMGIVSGMLAGLLIFVATLWLVIKGGPSVGPHLSLLGQFFPGYRVTFLGSFVGWGYGFAVGFVAGFMIGRIYNSIVRFGDR
jgi:hypothetical protein